VVEVAAQDKAPELVALAPLVEEMVRRKPQQTERLAQRTRVVVVVVHLPVLHLIHREKLAALAS
jgi:hypothetical protein